MAYNPFNRLYKITKWASWQGLTDAQKAGSMVFVNTMDDTTDGAQKRMIIYANGFTYDIADASQFNALYDYVHDVVDASISAIDSSLKIDEDLIADLSTYVYNTVNASISAIDSSLKKDEDTIADLSTYVYNTVNASISAIDSSLKKDEDTIADLSTYVYNTVNASISAIDSSLAKIDASLKADEATVNDLSTYVYNTVNASITNISNALSSITDISTYVHTTVNASISAIDSSLAKIDASLKADEATVDDLSTYVYNTVNASISAIDSSLAKIDASLKADEATVNDLSTYVYNTVNSSIININASISSIDSSLALVDSSLKIALKSVNFTSSVNSSNNGDATITLKSYTEAGDEATAAVDIIGNDYMVVSQPSSNTITLTPKTVTDKEGIANSTIYVAGTDSSLATAYAVKEYVEDQISTLESALEFKGEISSTTASTLLTTEARTQGDTYVATDAFTYTNQDGTTVSVEQGDLVIVKATKAAGANSNVLVVERNLDGAVTSASTLTVDHIVLGNDKQTVKTTNWVIGTEVAHTSNASTVASEKWVDLTVKAATDALKLTVNSSTPDYLVGRQGDASLGVEYGVVTATLADASDGAKGLALAQDVYQVIVDNEAVTANAFDAVKNSVGLETDFSVDWNNAFPSTYTIVDAIKNLSTDIQGVAGQSLTVDTSTPTYLVGSTNGSLGVKYGAVVRTYADVSADNTVDGLASIKDVYNVVSALSIDAIKEVAGEDDIELTDNTEVNGKYVTVKAVEDPSGYVTLNSSVLVTKSLTRLDGSTSSVAEGLATDAYVKDYVANALVWEIVD